MLGCRGPAGRVPDVGVVVVTTPTNYLSSRGAAGHYYSETITRQAGQAEPCRRQPMPSARINASQLVSTFGTLLFHFFFSSFSSDLRD